MPHASVGGNGFEDSSIFGTGQTFRMRGKLQLYLPDWLEKWKVDKNKPTAEEVRVKLKDCWDKFPYTGS
ncbi:hypothetical protein Pelo_10674 [Pelomyxa schiedti]|nr:hypothetical protein Pelo_10674 [Pelomyxa schiedti]